MNRVPANPFAGPIGSKANTLKILVQGEDRVVEASDRDPRAEDHKCAVTTLALESVQDQGRHFLRSSVREPV